MFPSAWAPGKLPSAPGSGKFASPCERMHWANLRAAFAGALAAGRDDTGAPEERSVRTVVVVSTAGAVLAGGAVVAMWATELGAPPPHADNAAAAAPPI